MIIDYIENISQYMGLNPNLDQAIREIARLDKEQISIGKVELDGERGTMRQKMCNGFPEAVNGIRS